MAPQPATNINVPHTSKLTLGGSTVSSITSEAASSGHFPRSTPKGEPPRLRNRAQSASGTPSAHHPQFQLVLYPATFLFVRHRRQRPYPDVRSLEEGKGEESNKLVCPRAPWAAKVRPTPFLHTYKKHHLSTGQIPYHSPGQLLTTSVGESTALFTS